MDMETLFSQALGIKDPWKITGISFDAEKKHLEVQVDFAKGASFDYTNEETQETKQYKAYDTVWKRWRHLNFFEHECYLVVRTPRIQPQEGGTKLVTPPWGGLASGFTLLFEALVLKMCTNMPVHQAGRILGVSDRKLWQVLEAYVEKALSKADHSTIKALGMDETSQRRGHQYITLFVDLLRRKTIHITEGKDSKVVHDFVKYFESSGGVASQVTDVSCDMSPAFIRGVKEALPNAEITFDKFHILKLINEAVDAVRRSEVSTHDCLKGARFAILKNASNLTQKQKETREKLSRMGLGTMRAVRIREAFQSIYQATTYEHFEQLLREWYFWATHSRLEAIKKVARTIRAHWDGILQWKKSQINNGILEALNSIIQAAKRKARGYKFEHFRVMSFLLTGMFEWEGINPHLPTRFA